MTELTQEQKDCNWLLKIIESCNATVHFDYVDKLIELFSEKHPQSELVEELKNGKTEQWNKVHNILT